MDPTTAAIFVYLKRYKILSTPVLWNRGVFIGAIRHLKKYFEIYAEYAATVAGRPYKGLKTKTQQQGKKKGETLWKT